MMNRLLPILLVAALPLSAADISPFREGVVKKSDSNPVEMPYLVHVPQGAADKKWPLVIFLHGAGERGKDLSRLKKHGPTKLIANGKDLPAVVAAPLCAEKEWWNPESIKALADQLIETEPVDPDRVLLTGLSMGGFGTWATALEYPGAFAAIAPICGRAQTDHANLQKIAKLPVWIFHGDADTVVPPDNSKEMAAKLKEMGGSPKLTIYPEVGHDSWTQTYDSQEFWDWFLAQKR